MHLPLQIQALLLTLSLNLLAIHSFSQGKARGTVKGAIVDTVGRQNLAAATVSVTPVADSSGAQFVVTNKQGAFLVRNLRPDKYRLIITFEGFQPVVKLFTIDTANLNIDFSTLYMERATQEMTAVIVQRPPMQIKGDTIEYNAGMYAVKPNAVAEDLLKKFPGIQVDASGNITAQGEKVQRVLVNGQRFFSDDPKLATRNLPPDVIEKISVFDDLDDQSKFSGIDDGNRVKTINITTKKDKRQGYFGRAVAGAGTNEDYDNSINMHRFDNEQQVSVLGQANDINKQNFTIQDILGNSGGRRGGGGPAAATNQSSPGVTTVWAGGANYRDNWGPNTTINGSYFYNFQHVSSDGSSLSFRNNFSNPDSSNTSNQAQSAFQRTTNQRINLNLESKFDSSNTNSLVFRPNLSFQTTRPNASSNSSTVDQNGSPVNTTSGHNSSVSSGYNINGSNLTFRHKFSKPMRTISLDLNGTVNVNDGNGTYYSLNHYYKLEKGPADSVQLINQYYNDSLHSYSFSPTLSYTEPIGKNQVLELNYNYSYSKNTTVNNTYDFVDSAHGYSAFDSLFSNSYKFTSTSNRVSLNYRVFNTKFNLNIGSGVQFMDFKSVNTTKGITVAPSTYVNLTPTAAFQYSFSRTQRLRLFYQGRTGTPSASQLQPLTTTSDDVNFVVGNPDLKPQFTHNLRVLYSSFDPGTQNVLFATINASTTVNDIQTATIPNEKGGQTSTYVNLNGTYNLSGFFNYGFALKKPKSNLNFITNVNYSQSQSLFDAAGFNAPVAYQSDYTRNTSFGETISWTTNIKKNFDMNFSSSSNYNIGRNSLHPSQNLDYFTQKFGAEITAYTNNGWLIAATFDYTYTNTRTPGYNASVPLLSPSIAKSLFKKKNGEIRLSTFDLLNANTYVNKTVTAAGYTASRTNTLSRYLMLTFTWNLNNFAASNQRRMPGMFPGMFRGPGGGGGGGGRRGGFGPGGD
ncbi:MAG: outer membrane beta-barrel protein [Bacteroidota bacterium]|nr:outer membrane beta-barrel protein [Bacteroidota bacterium]MDP4244934.1 outer membrane beta-barrel protein [Bacteroidota bacterium]MDP4258452.1 outer membrane beta-barrel protein [Bacteroidota bacterium]